MTTFVSIPYSPWSEKARFALLHHGLSFREQHYRPMLDELPMRLRLRDLRGKLTIPIYFEGGLVLRDSLHIAQHADRVGRGAPLFPEEQLEEILAWEARSEAALAEGRLRTADKTRASDAAQRELLRGIVPEALRGPLIGIARVGIAYVERKYGGSPRGEHLEAALEQLAAALAGGRPYLVGDALSYADIAMAATLQFVEPVDARYLRLGSANREVWRDAALAARYPALIAWRDAIYARHRLTAAGRPPA